MALTHTPLTEEQKTLPSGMVLPSGEGNYFDFSQHHSENSGSGINFPFTQDTSGSGLIETYGPEGIANTGSVSGTFVADGLTVPFSNAQDVTVTQIDDFTIFNDYVHYYPGVDGASIQIPFLSTSTLTAASDFDPYKL